MARPLLAGNQQTIWTAQMPMTQVLAHPCSRAIVQTTKVQTNTDHKAKMFKHRTSTNAQTKMIKHSWSYTADIASAEQTVRRFFYERRVGVSTLLSNHSLLHKYISGQHCTYIRNQPQSNINTQIHILDCLFGSPSIKVNIRFSCKQTARSADDTSHKTYI